MRRLVGVVLTSLLGCQGSPSPPAPPAPAPPGPGPSAKQAAPLAIGTEATGDANDDAGLDAEPRARDVNNGPVDLDPRLTEAPAAAARSIGHTSVVFRLRVRDASSGEELPAAFKPRSVVGGRRYRGEVAAYRLACALGLANVVPAALRRFDGAAFRALIPPEMAEAIVDEKNGALEGAILPWVNELGSLALEREPLRSAWKAALASGGGPRPDVTDAMASAISDMIVFDYVTGNWDRWSGGNVGQVGTGDRARILFVDNDGAFYDVPPAPALARQKLLLQAVHRFSRSFVAALRRVDVTEALGVDLDGAPLLSPAATSGVERRRLEALGIIEAAVRAEAARRGDTSTAGAPESGFAFE